MVVVEEEAKNQESRFVSKPEGVFRMCVCVFLFLKKKLLRSKAGKWEFWKFSENDKLILL